VFATGSTSRREIMYVRRISGWLMLTGVVVFVLLAAVGKLVDLAMFRRSIESLKIVPEYATRYVAFTVAWAELLLAFSWLLGLRRRSMGIGIAALISFFTAVYGYLLLKGERPNCSCLGLLARYIVLQNEGQAVLIRNVILLGLMGVGAGLLTGSRTTALD